MDTPTHQPTDSRPNTQPSRAESSSVLHAGKKALLFPVETISRELDFRLVLAGFCARPGNQIFIGNHTDIYELGKRLKNGLYVGKNLLNVSPTRLRVCYEDLKKNDFRVIYLDEEGAIFSGEPDDWRADMIRKFDPRWLEAEDYACSWGTFQDDLYHGLAPKCREHIVRTGHPRFSLCHSDFLPLYADEVRRLQGEHGRYILVSTNFTRANFGTGTDYFFKRYHVTPESELRTTLIDEFAYNQQKLAIFIRLINRLSNELPDHTIILRPHPSEGHAIYQSLLQYVPRAKIEVHGSLTAWLRGAEAMIHCGCTTGIEGWLSDTFVMNYQPLHDERFERKVPNMVGQRCESEDAVIQTLKDALATSGKSRTSISEQGFTLIKSLINNVQQGRDGFTPLTDLVEDVVKEISPAQAIGSLTSFARRGRVERVKKFIRSKYPPFIKPWQPRSAYRHQRFPGLNPVEIDQKLAFVSQLTGRPLDAHYLSSKLMSITTH